MHSCDAHSIVRTSVTARAIQRPFLEVEPGRYLFSANEICRYFLETNPRGKSLLNPKMDNDWIGWEVTMLKVRKWNREDEGSCADLG